MAATDYFTLRNCLKKNISFAAYTLPGETKFFLIIQKDKAQILRQLSGSEKGFILHPFTQDKDYPLLLIKNDFCFREGDTCTELNEYMHLREEKNNFAGAEPLLFHKLKTKKYALENKKAYLQLFKKFKHAIDQGRFEKLILSRIKNIPIDDVFDIIRLFEKLNKKYPHAFNHLSFTPYSGVWLGSSPEILLSMDSETAETVALAGTQKKTLAKKKWKAKEKHEQQHVVDFVGGVLKKYVPESLIKISYKSLEAGKMLHLCTNFSFPSKYLKNLPVFLGDLHPTPAVCGLPKEKALEFISRNEPHDRGYYSGFLGPVNIKHQTHLFVNLRCLHMQKNVLSLFLGGGLTKDSEGETEWEETELKSTTLTCLL